MAIQLKDEGEFSLELTPMIDVVFLLIVFFLLTTTFAQLEREMKVSVPPSESGKDSGESLAPLVINVMPDGRIVDAGNQVDIKQLQSLVARRVEDEPKTKALIRAHKALAYERIIEVAGACSKAKANIAFATLKTNH